jgi:Protein of unknown function (DUF4242)
MLAWRWPSMIRGVVTARSTGNSVDGASEWAVEVSVPIFLAERDTAGTTEADIGQVHRALEAAARRLGSSDHRVRYLRSIYIPGEQRCICFFEASDADIVRLVNDTAQLPFVRIAAAVEFAPTSGGLGAAS